MAKIERRKIRIYPYHNKIKQRIKNGELIGYTFVHHYGRIGECLVLHFKTYPFERPIRPYRYGEYADILAQWEKQANRIFPDEAER